LEDFRVCVPTFRACTLSRNGSVDAAFAAGMASTSGIFESLLGQMDRL